MLVAAGVGGLALISWYFREENVLRRRMARTPRTPIERISGGAVCVHGRASRAADVLVAPVTQRHCLAFVLTVFEEGEGGRAPLARLRQARPFWLEDGSGRALVEPGSHFEVLVGDVQARLSEPSMSEAAIHSLRQVLREWGVSTEARIGSRRILHYDERVVLEGPAVSVGGRAVVEVNPRGETGGGRGSPQSLVLRGGDASDPLLIATEPAQRV